MAKLNMFDKIGRNDKHVAKLGKLSNQILASSCILNEFLSVNKNANPFVL